MVAALHRMRDAALRIPLRAIFAVGSTGLPLALLLVAGLVGQQMQHGVVANQTLQRLAIASARPRELFSALQEAESGQRGYLLTGQARYLEPYDKAVARVPAALKNLDLLTAVNPSSQSDVIALRQAARAKLEELARSIDLYRSGKIQDALALVRSGAGQSEMDSVRRINTTLRAPIANLIAQQVIQRRDSTLLAEELVGTLLVIITVFGIFSGTMIFLNLKERERALAETARTEKERVNLMDQLGDERERLMATVDDLYKAKQAADEANRAKSEFLASMSHELRTPLNAILGFSEVIKDELFGPVGLTKYVDYANDVHKSGQLLLDLINDVLDLSKIDAGKMDLREDDVAVTELVQDCVTLVRERALKAGVALSVALDAPIYVRADTRFLKQILLNLLSNAIKFTPQGGSVAVTGGIRNGDFRLSVRDTGIGMTPDEITRAMSTYGQIDSKVSRKHQGTGLGLPISRSLAELHGGTLTVDSIPDRGTEICLILPAARVVTPETNLSRKSG